jgi:HD-GYP domain-containing protein (c-di-GMP phosphodiesterase class II)
MLKTQTQKISTQLARQFKKFASQLNIANVNCRICSAQGDILLEQNCSSIESDCQSLSKICHNTCQTQENISEFHGKSTLLASAFNTENDSDLVAIIEISNNDLDHRKSDYILLIRQLLEMFTENITKTSKSEKQMEKISTELALSYEELTMLYRLSNNMHLTLDNNNFLQIACDSITDIVLVEGIAVLQNPTEDEHENQMMVAAGSGIINIDDNLMFLIKTRLKLELDQNKQYLLDSDVDSKFCYEWPENIRSIIAVPLESRMKNNSSQGNLDGGKRMLGLLVAVNRMEKADFDSQDAKLLKSVANSCAVFMDNGMLFSDLKELFMGSLRALTSSIDAKDRYTRGHSERVSYISRWIAERLKGDYKLNKQEIDRIYLAGLLHDIGKIGIPETVLCKNGALTDDEYALIKHHPAVGANILRKIKQMREILDGALYHHERWDGRGYPKGVSEQKIPLVGRIICVADTFDAMTSKRTYRDALSLDKAIKEIENGLAKQFDPVVGQTFLDSDIKHLWNMLQDGAAEIGSETENIDAVGTLVA